MTSKVSLLDHPLAVVLLWLEKAEVQLLDHPLAVLPMPPSSDHVLAFSFSSSTLLFF
jgi:hypothetical protein